MIAEGLEIDMNIAINQIVVTRSSSSSFHASEIEHQFGPRRHDFRTAIKPGNTAKGKRRIRPSGIKPVQIVDSEHETLALRRCQRLFNISHQITRILEPHGEADQT